MLELLGSFLEPLAEVLKVDFTGIVAFEEVGLIFRPEELHGSKGGVILREPLGSHEIVSEEERIVV